MKSYTRGHENIASYNWNMQTPPTFPLALVMWRAKQAYNLRRLSIYKQIKTHTRLITRAVLWYYFYDAFLIICFCILKSSRPRRDGNFETAYPVRMYVPGARVKKVEKGFDSIQNNRLIFLRLRTLNSTISRCKTLRSKASISICCIRENVIQVPISTKERRKID